MKFISLLLLISLPSYALDSIDAIKGTPTPDPKAKPDKAFRSAAEMAEQLKKTPRNNKNVLVQSWFDDLTEEAHQKLNKIAELEELVNNEKDDARSAVRTATRTLEVSDRVSVSYLRDMGLDEDVFQRFLDLSGPDDVDRFLNFHLWTSTKHRLFFETFRGQLNQLPEATLERLGELTGVDGNIMKVGDPDVMRQVFSPEKIKLVIRESRYMLSDHKGGAKKALEKLDSMRLQKSFGTLLQLKEYHGFFLAEQKDRVKYQAGLNESQKRALEVLDANETRSSEIRKLQTEVDDLKSRIAQLDGSRIRPPKISSAPSGLQLFQAEQYARLPQPGRFTRFLRFFGRAFGSFGGGVSAGAAGVMIYNGMKSARGTRKDVDLSNARSRSDRSSRGGVAY